MIFQWLLVAALSGTVLLSQGVFGATFVVNITDDLPGQLSGARST